VNGGLFFVARATYHVARSWVQMPKKAKLSAEERRVASLLLPMDRLVATHIRSETANGQDQGCKNTAKHQERIHRWRGM
jgi:hypothetical protein